MLTIYDGILFKQEIFIMTWKFKQRRQYERKSFKCSVIQLLLNLEKNKYHPVGIKCAIVQLSLRRDCLTSENHSILYKYKPFVVYIGFHR